MIRTPTSSRTIPTFLVPFTQSTTVAIPSIQTRTFHLHKNIRTPPIPRPTPLVPDVQTFLTVIGRGLSQHASKITSWRQLFSISSENLRELGVEPPRSRRYLLHWIQRFRNGQFGIGGDFAHVNNGVAKLRVVEVPTKGRRPGTATQTPDTRKIVINVEDESAIPEGDLKNVVPVKGLTVKGAHTIVGPHVLPIKGGKGGKIEVKEGLWEHRRGHKIDGGERRQAEVRAKRRAEERKSR